VPWALLFFSPTTSIHHSRNCAKSWSGESSNICQNFFIKSLQFGKELLNRIQIGRIGWQINKLDTCFIIYLLNPLCAVEGSIIYNKYRFRFWPLAIVAKELLKEILKDFAICRSLKNTRKKEPVLGIRR